MIWRWPSARPSSDYLFCALTLRVFPQTPFRFPSLTTVWCVGQPMATFHALGIVPNPSAGYYDPALLSVGVRSTTRLFSAARGGYTQLSLLDLKLSSTFSLEILGAPKQRNCVCRQNYLVGGLTLCLTTNSDVALVGTGPVARALHIVVGPQLPTTIPPSYGRRAVVGATPLRFFVGYADPFRLRPASTAFRLRPFVPLRALSPFASASPPRPQSVWVGCASPSDVPRRGLSN